MKRNTTPRSYLLLIIVLFLMINIPRSHMDAMRSGFVMCLAPFTQRIANLKTLVQLGMTKIGSLYYSERKTIKPAIEEEIHRLRLENELLQNQLSYLQELFDMENQLQQRLQYQEEQCYQELSNLQLRSLPARVVFRAQSSWYSSLWINAGERNNRKLGSVVVAKNSPVVLDMALLGVIDYVGQSWSRVLLITDPSLTPSVRAVRGCLQNRILMEHINALLDALTSRDDLDSSEELHHHLQVFKEGLSSSKRSWFLAKGELHGQCTGLWRHTKGMLKGSGFNYDFPDKEGPARDLRSGKAVNGHDERPILKVNDLLITTGMDGIFPAGLHVAQVTKINTLCEGGYYYDLEAKPIINNIDDLSLVFVLPPILNLQCGTLPK